MAVAGKQRSTIESLGAAAIAALQYAGGMALLLSETLRWTVLGIFSPRDVKGRPRRSEERLRNVWRCITLGQGGLGVTGSTGGIWVVSRQGTPYLILPCSGQWIIETSFPLIISCPSFGEPPSPSGRMHARQSLKI